MATRTHQLLPEGAQYLSGTAVPKLSKLNGTAFPVSSLLFRKDADESAYFKLPIIGYTSGDITFQVIWFSNGAATTGNVIWGAAVSAVSPNLDNVGVLTKSFATEATVSTAHLGGQAQRLHASTVTITSLDQMRASDQVWLRLTRKDDTYTDDVHVTQIVLSYPASSAGLESGGYYDIHTYATYEVCRNETGTTIAKATPVYISGRQGDKILVAPADAANSAKMPAIGLVADTIDTGTDGYVHVIGANKGVNTNAYALNQTLYVAPGGGLTPTKPANPNLIQNIGKVISVATNGEILILGPGRTNDVPALAQSHVFIGNASGVTEQRQMTFADISGGGGNVTFAGVTVAETTANETPLSVSGYSLTGAGDVPALNVAGTWNTSAAPALLRANVTDTLSNAGALLLELRKNNVAQFTVGKEGQVASNAVTISGYSLTGTLATSALDISGTWNTTGTPTAIKLNITDTASNAASLLMSLQTGGTPRFSVGKTGILSLRSGAVAGDISVDNTGRLLLSSSSTSGARVVGDFQIGATDVVLLRDAAGILAQRNGTNPQIFRIYNTYTDASNWERGKIAWTGNIFAIGTEKAGTGTARQMELMTDGQTRVVINPVGRVGVDVSPTAKFEVRETSNQAPLRIQNSQNTQHSGWELYVGYPGNYDGYLSFRRAGQALPGAMSIAQNDSVTVWNSLSVADGKEIGSATGIGLAHYLPYRNTTGISGQITFRNHLTGAALFSFNGYYYDGTNYNLIPSILNIRQASATDARVGVGTTTPGGKFAVADTVLSGSGSLATSLVDLTQTWNTTGTPTAIKLNVTDTASNAASLLLDLQRDGTSRFRVNKNGVCFTPALNGSAEFVTVNVGTNSGGNDPTVCLGGVSAEGVSVRAGSAYAWTSDPNNSAFASRDLLLRRDAAGVLAQRNGTNAQTFRVYNTFTDASNYERGKIEWASNVLRIGTEKAGTGTARALEFQTDAVTRLTVGASGGITLADANDIAVGTTTGTKIGTATGQKLGFWNAAPVAQPTTAVAEGAFVENGGGTAVNEDSTFDGYTLQQVVRALRDIGLLA